jgi:L,D-peptidoglycan transpeptidase YkuD (ErfK/YbiS/YcfS/YnhG family)
MEHHCGLERAYLRVAGGVCAFALLALVFLAPSTMSPAAVFAESLPQASAETTQQSLPGQMAYTLGAQQVIIATGARLGSKTGTLQVFDLVDDEWVQTLQVPAKFGKRGLIDGNRRREGSKTTPTGIWTMPSGLFGTHATPPAGTKMSYRRIKPRSWWSSKRGKTYNTWVNARSWRGERLGSAGRAYEFAVSTGYNARPNRSVYGRGSGIFLHVQRPGLTSGCIAISRADMIRVCTMLDPAKRPVFAVGTLEQGKATSIWAY